MHMEGERKKPAGRDRKGASRVKASAYNQGQPLYVPGGWLALCIQVRSSHRSGKSFDLQGNPKVSIAAHKSLPSHLVDASLYSTHHYHSSRIKVNLSYQGSLIVNRQNQAASASSNPRITQSPLEPNPLSWSKQLTPFPSFSQRESHRYRVKDLDQSQRN